VWVRFPPKVQQNKKKVNCERASKKKARFLFEVKRSILFFVFQAQLEGNIDAVNESHFIL